MELWEEVSSGASYVAILNPLLYWCVFSVTISCTDSPESLSVRVHNERRGVRSLTVIASYYLVNISKMICNLN